MRWLDSLDLGGRGVWRWRVVAGTERDHRRAHRSRHRRGGDGHTGQSTRVRMGLGEASPRQAGHSRRTTRGLSDRAAGRSTDDGGADLTRRHEDREQSVA